MSHTFTNPTKVGFDPQRLDRIKPAMQRYIDSGLFSGISTMLARRGEIVHSEQVGHQNRDTKTPLAADSIYRIYSMTKPIICTALMTLHEEGRFQLFHPVAKYLPAFGKVKVLEQIPHGGTKLVTPERPMTIQHLFTHTSGITYNFLEESPVCKMYLEAGLMSDANMPLADVIAELAQLPLVDHPGSGYHYSMSIDVLAHLIEVLADQPLADFLAERIFQPLGMADTAFSVPEAKRSRVATMYGHPDVTTHTFNQINEAWQNGFNEEIDMTETYPTHDAPNFQRGGHGLFSTAGDYMRFAQMLLNGGELDGARILGRKTVEFMHSNHVPLKLLPYQIGPIAPAPGYGFGLGSRVLLDPPATGVPGSVGEYGWAGAAKTYYWVDPKEELVGVFMSQFMMAMALPDMDFRVLVYQALVD
ncbi:MAG: serine hydrolase domain-containing protein [Caldilineaceae bacterium]